MTNIYEDISNAVKGNYYQKKHSFKIIKVLEIHDHGFNVLVLEDNKDNKYNRETIILGYDKLAGYERLTDLEIQEIEKTQSGLEVSAQSLPKSTIEPLTVFNDPYGPSNPNKPFA
ncbi:MAG: hypothetical protein Q7S33_05300 [Nanoarchaeota archaeon]|nr:hypothetical protein [Nanoarchaeota archaeon]